MIHCTRTLMFAGASAVILASCTAVPMTEERAEALCREDIGQADGISGSVGVGVGTGSARTKGSITVTNRVFNPQTEEEFLRDCIDRRMGRAPEETTIGITLGASS